MAADKPAKRNPLTSAEMLINELKASRATTNEMIGVLRDMRGTLASIDSHMGKLALRKDLERSIQDKRLELESLELALGHVRMRSGNGSSVK